MSKLKRLYNEIIDSLNHQDAKTLGSCKILQIKKLQRNLLQSMESKRRFVEEKRSCVDQKILQLENLNYKRAYLKRQINFTKDNTCNATNSIEDELDKKGNLTITNYSDDLNQRKDLILADLQVEEDYRKLMKEDLEKNELELKLTIENLDKKRKFIEALPFKISALLNSSEEIKSLFIGEMS